MAGGEEGRAQSCRTLFLFGAGFSALVKTKNEPLCEGGRRVCTSLEKEGDFGKEPVKVEAWRSLALGRAATEDVVRQAGVSGRAQT